MLVQTTPVLSVDACDPQHLIRDALGGGDAGEAWSARELYLAWLMNLPIEVDAAHSAEFAATVPSASRIGSVIAEPEVRIGRALRIGLQDIEAAYKTGTRP